MAVFQDNDKYDNSDLLLLESALIAALGSGGSSPAAADITPVEFTGTAQEIFDSYQAWLANAANRTKKVIARTFITGNDGATMLIVEYIN